MEANKLKKLRKVIKDDKLCNEFDTEEVKQELKKRK